VPLFCRTRFLAVLVVPTTCEENVRVVGVTLAEGAVPVPVSASVCDAPILPELSATFSCPVAGPATEGVNETFTVQLEPAARLLGQLFVSRNPEPAEIFTEFSVLPPKLAMVIVWDGLVAPTFWEKSRVDGVNLMAEGCGLGSGTGVMPNT
jgi:hypothetical protein